MPETVTTKNILLKLDILLVILLVVVVFFGYEVFSFADKVHQTNLELKKDGLLHD